MDLTERKRRLKMFLEQESDKEMMSAFVEFTNNADEFQKLSDEEKLEKWKEKFHFLIDDNYRISRLQFCGGLVKTFMEAAVLIDDLTAAEAAEHASEVLNQLDLSID